MRNTYLKVLLIIVVLIFGTMATAQAQETSIAGKRIKFVNPTQQQLTTIVASGIDLKCGADFVGNDLFLELAPQELETLDTNGVNYNVVVDDLASFYQERNTALLPVALQKLEVEKQKALNQDNNNQQRSLSTTATAISNVIQYEGATEEDWATPQNFSLGATMGGCLTYDEMLAQLDLMRAMYPNLISIKKDASLTEDGTGTPITTHGNNFTNGGQYETWPGQTIYYVRISDNPDTDEAGEPESFYSGMSHSREVSSMMNLMYYMWYVLENYDSDPDVKNLVDNHEMYFVPVANPDGLKWNEQVAPSGGGLQRKNLNPSANTGNNELRGVDLNRNYSYLWGTAFGGSSSTTSSNVYRGTSPFSEPETQIVEKFTEYHDVKTALNHHATSNLLPHGYNGEVGAPASGREDDYAQFCQDLTRFNRYIYGEAPNILTVANGDMSDWMLGGPSRTNSDGSTSTGSGKGILALAPENGDPDGFEADPNLGSSFWPAPDQIVRIAKRAMRMNFVNALYAGKLAQLHDMTPSNITTTSGTLDFGIEYLGMTSSDITLTVTPITNITSIGTLPVQTGWSNQEQRERSITYQLDPAISANDPIEYEVTLSNDSHIIYQATITKYYAPTELFVDNPDVTGIANWTASSDWAITTDAFSGSTAITNDPTPPYAENRNATLTLNTTLNLATVNTAVIQFNAKWDMERNFDYAQIQASTDGGATWNALNGKYTKPGATLGSTRYSPVTGSGGSAKSTADRNNQPDGKPVYEGFNDGKWVLEEIEISAAANTFAANAPNLQLRFLFNSDSNNNADGYTTTFDGFTFDDFKVLSYDLDRSCQGDIIDTFAYSEGFEGGLGSWTQNTEDDGDLTLGSDGTPSANTGPSAASEGTYYYFAESTANNIGVGANAEVIVTSPCIDFNGDIVADFDFDYHMLGSSTGSLVLQSSPSTNNTWTTIFSRTGAQSTNGTDWKTASVDLSAFTNTTIQLRFVVTTGNGALSDIAIDNLKIVPADTTNPEANCQNITVTLDATGSIVILPSQIDNNSTDNIGIESYSLDVDTFDCTNVGDNNVVLTVTDFGGNTATCSAVVTINSYTIAPSGLNASTVSTTSATLQWDAAASNDYDVRFRESGTTTWTTNNVTTNNINLTSLTSNTTYEAQVRANCGAGTTDWSATITFTTDAICTGTTISMFAPYNESFESGLGDWTQDNTDSANFTRDSGGTPTNNTGPSTGSDGSFYMYTEGNGTGGSTARLLSPCIDFSSFSTASLSVDYHMYGNATGSLSIEALNEAGTAWDVLFTRAGQQSTNGTDWKNATINMDSYTGRVTRVRISVLVGSGGGSRSDTAIDNITFSAGTIDYIYDAGAWTPSDPSGISTAVDNIQVLSGSPTLTGNTSINNVTISSGATLNLGVTALDVAGNYTNFGNTSGVNGTLVMSGSTQQGILGNAFELANLVINNSDTVLGVVLSAPVTITELLTLSNGALNTTNNLTLASTASGTAMVDVITNGSIIGNVTAERYIPAKRAFRLLSSPVSSTTSINANWQEGANNTGVNFPTDNMNPNPGFGTHITGSTTGANGFDATASGNGSIFKLNNAGQSWEGVPNTDVTTLTAGEPIRLMVRGDRSINVTTNAAAPTPTTLRATGTLATTTVTTTGTNLNHTADAFNFIGNPYQASVNVNNVLSGSTNLKTSQVWVWDATLGDRGQYVTVVLDGSGSSNGANSKNYHFIQPGQSLFTQTAATVTNSSTAIVFNETDKAIGNDVTVYNNDANAFDFVPHLITKLYRTDRYGLDEGLQDNFVILFDNNYSNNVTGEDVSKFFNIDENMGVYREGSLLSVDRVKMPTEEDEVQLYNALYRVSDYTLDIDVNGLDEVTVYLQDDFTGESIALNSGLNTIDFTVDTEIEESIAATRFKITYEKEVLATEEQQLINVNLYPNPVTNGSLTITSTELAGTEVSLSITNILGQKVYRDTATFKGNSAVINNLNNLSSGLYILSITSDDLQVSHKIVIQ